MAYGANPEKDDKNDPAKAAVAPRGKQVLPPLEIASAQPAQQEAKAATPGAPQTDAPPTNDFTKLVGEQGKGMEAANKQIQALDLQTMRLRPPELKLPPKPEPTNQGVLAGWATAAMMLAVFGSKMSRTPRMAAMNAAAAAIKGLREGNQEAIDNAFRTWQQESSNAEHLAHFEMSAYKEVLHTIKDREGNIAAAGADKDRTAAAKLHALTTAFGNPGPYIAYQKNGWAGVEEYQKKQEAIEKQEREARELNSKYFMMNKAMQDRMQSPDWQNLSLAEKDAARHEIMSQNGMSDKFKASPMTPDEMEAHIQAILDYREAAPKGKLRQDPTWQTIWNQVVQRGGKDFSEGMYDIVKRAEGDLVYGAGGKTRKALTTGKNHLEFLDALSKDLPNEFDLQAKNKIAAAISQQFGLPEVPAFETAVSIVGAELAKAVTGVNPALKDRQEIRDAYKLGNSKVQMRAVVDSMKELIGGQLNGLRKQYEPVLPGETLDKFFGKDTLDYFKSSRKPKEEKAKTEGASSAKADTGIPMRDGSPAVGRVTKPDGQKAPVWSSPGGGYVYEDGTPVPDEVLHRAR